MPTWRKSDSMPKVRASSGTMGTINFPSRSSRSNFASNRTKTIVVEASRPRAPRRALVESREHLLLRRPDGFARHDAGRDVPAELLSPLLQVLNLTAVLRRAIERSLGDLIVGDGNAEAGAELAQLVFVELLVLMRAFPY